jgi:vancomycin resistance protein YoaR
LGIEKTIDILAPAMEDFHQTYDLNAQLIQSVGTQPKFTTEFMKKYSEKPDTQREEMLYAYAKQDIHVELPIQVIALKEISNYALYVTKKNLEGQSKCALTNYLTAFYSLDKLTLQPEQTFNLNKHIANLPGYCKGRGNQDLRFFGGVCGVSTQLFRTSLMHPYLTVLQRHPHSQRFTRYYSDTVYGDDAAIYEMSKQFEIKNTGPEMIYLRSLHKGNTTYLIAAHSKQSQQPPKVTLKKQQIGKLQGKVEKQIHISQESIKNERLSRYIKKNTSWN